MPSATIFSSRAFGELYHLGAAMILDEGFAGSIVVGDETFSQAEYEKQRLFLRTTAPNADGRLRSIQRVDYERGGAPASNATKAITAAFAKDAAAARQRLLDRWIGTMRKADELDVKAAVPEAIRDHARPKLLVWSRVSDYEPERNMTAEVLEQLVQRAVSLGIRPILLGNPLAEAQLRARGDVDVLFGHWKLPGLATPDTYQRQLCFAHLLRRDHRVLGAVGVKSGTLDGPALLGMPTVQLESKHDPKVSQGEGTPKRGRLHPLVHPTVPDYHLLPTDSFLRPKAKAPSLLTKDELDTLGLVFKRFRHRAGQGDMSADELGELARRGESFGDYSGGIQHQFDHSVGR
jgi:hypothetical protein